MYLLKSLKTRSFVNYSINTEYILAYMGGSFIYRFGQLVTLNEKVENLCYTFYRAVI